MPVPSPLPPLPPGKRSSKKLSSTYLSFRDPAIELWSLDEVVMGLKRNEKSCTRNQIGLFRSHSEGNLHVKKSQPASTPLDKCIKAIYGSWRNLMQRKNTLLPVKGHTPPFLRGNQTKILRHFASRPEI